MSGETIIEGGGLRVVFARAGDRFSHTIGYVARSASDFRLPTSDFRSPTSDLHFVPLLESIEGTPDDAWPASPPLQSLHCEDRPDGKQLALLVGMAGRSHWSLSLELDPALGTVTCDVACRLHDEPGALTSTYRIVQTPVSMIGGSLALSSGARRFQLLLPQTADQHRCGLGISGASQVVVRNALASGPLPRTERWRYALTAERPSHQGI
ncbi:MAG: hypothetical protein HY000_22275 [Planctomycetes bacterium]|nr:hypothetical protein [Planctomycetota bacterium]